MKKNTLRILMVLLVLSMACTAQEREQFFSSTDSAAINALVLYPDSIRDDIFEACQHPELLVRLANEQKITRNNFQELLAPYSKTEQEELWNFTRYPNLISTLVSGGNKSKAETEKIVSGYPEEIRKSAMKYVTNNFEILTQINSLQENAEIGFHKLLAGYPPKTVLAYNELICLPEILTILNDHLDIVVLTGDSYKRNPEHVRHVADSLNLAISRKQAEELIAWKDSIQKDTNAVNDFKEAATEYANDQGYSGEQLHNHDGENVIVNYTYNPYPYWFGYPVWYPYPYWNPYPFWFDCGFYYDAWGSMIIINVPSYYFVNWYFYYPEHWHHYPYIGHSLVRHYYGPRRGSGSNTSVVNRWVTENKRYIPQDFINNKSRGVETMRELGELNNAKDERGNLIKTDQRDEYYNKNRSKYPTLNKSDRNIFKSDSEIKPNQPSPTRTDQKEKIQKPERIQPSYERIQKAKEYHRDNWDRTSPREVPKPIDRQPEPRKIIQPERVNPNINPSSPRPSPAPPVPAPTPMPGKSAGGRK